MQMHGFSPESESKCNFETLQEKKKGNQIMKKSGFIAALAAGMILLAGCGSTQKDIDASELAKSLV